MLAMINKLKPDSGQPCADPTFVEKVTTKFGIGAVHAVKAFLDAKRVQPTAEQIGMITSRLTPLIVTLVAEAAPTPDAPMELFNRLLHDSCATGIAVAIQVLKLSPSPVRH